MSEWPSVRFQSLAADSKSAFSKPYGSAIMKEDYISQGVPVVRGINLRKGIFHDDEFVFIAEGKANQMPGANLAPGDLVITHRGTIGQVSMIPRNPRYPRYVLSTSQVKARLDPKRALPEFYYYWFSSLEGKRELLGNVSTVGVPGLAQPVATVKSLKVPHPPLTVQKAIAEVLCALDNKIAANDRVTSVSSELAFAHGITAMDGESEDEVSMAECAQIIKGVSYRSADLTGTGALVSLKCVGPNGYFQADGVKPYSGDFRPEQVLQDGDIVVAHTDLTQRAEVIGRPARVVNLGDWNCMVASLDLAIVRPTNGLTREIAVALLSSQRFHDYALSYCNGTTVLHMSVRALPTFRFNKPSNEVVARVTAVMRPLFSQSDQARRENLTLTELRDTLLLGLMTRKIRTRDAERIVEGAT